jgi:hypothetical protein
MGNLLMGTTFTIATIATMAAMAAMAAMADLLARYTLRDIAIDRWQAKGKTALCRARSKRAWRVTRH